MEDYKKLDEEFWGDSNQKLTEMTINDYGWIEDSKDSLIVNFANRSIGGRSMKDSKAQEEKLFLVFPELLFSLLLFPQMEDNQAIVVRGLKRYNSYVPYKKSLCFQELDDNNGDDKVFSTVTCIDALNLRKSEAKQDSQFKKEKSSENLTKLILDSKEAQKKKRT